MAEEEAPEVEAGGNEGGSGYALMTDAWPDMVKVGQAKYHHHLCRHHYRLARNGKDSLTQHHIINIKQDIIIIIIVIIALMANASSIIGHGQCHLQEILLSLSTCQLSFINLQHQLQINNNINNF